MRGEGAGFAFNLLLVAFAFLAGAFDFILKPCAMISNFYFVYVVVLPSP